MSIGFITALCVAVLSLGLIVLISSKCQRSWKTNLSSSLLMLLIVGAAVYMLYDSGVFGRRKINRNFHVQDFETVRAFIFGKYLSQKYPGQKVLIVNGADEKDKALNEAVIESLKKGLGDKMKPLAVVDLETERDKKYGFLKYSKVTSVDFDLLLGKYGDCEILISILPFPGDFKKMKMFSYGKGGRVGLAALNGPPHGYVSEVKKGNILAATCFKPMWTYTPDIPADQLKAFELRYLLVCPETLDDITARYPRLLR